MIITTWVPGFVRGFKCNFGTNFVSRDPVTFENSQLGLVFTLHQIMGLGLNGPSLEPSSVKRPWVPPSQPLLHVLNWLLGLRWGLMREFEFLRFLIIIACPILWLPQTYKIEGSISLQPRDLNPWKKRRIPAFANVVQRKQWWFPSYFLE